MVFRSQSRMTPPEDDPPQTSRVAWLALLLSLLSVAMSGYALIRTGDLDSLLEGFRAKTQRIRENTRTLSKETSRLFGSKTGGETAEEAARPEDAKSGADTGSGAGGESAGKPGGGTGTGKRETSTGEAKPAPPSSAWERLTGKIADLGVLVRSKDGQASEYLDTLKRDLMEMRDAATGRGAKVLEESLAKLREVREEMRFDGKGAAAKLEEIGRDLAASAGEAFAREAVREASGGAAGSPSRPASAPKDPVAAGKGEDRPEAAKDPGDPEEGESAP